MNIVNTPYDDVFRTLLNDCSELIIPVVNEVFDENYTGKEKIIFAQNEHFLNQQDGKENKCITDSHLAIVGATETKQYHWECQSTPDSTLLVRFFEYDTQIALDHGVLESNVLTVTFPHAAVLFLRCNKSTPDFMTIKMITPGGEVSYDVKVMKSQQYTLDEIFEKNLLFLIPFYIFTHEKNFQEFNENQEKLESLKEEYKVIVSELEKRQQQGLVNVYTKNTIIEMSNKVLENIAAKYENVRKGVRSIMGGQILEYETKNILNKGIAIGEERGIIIGEERGIIIGEERGIIIGEERGELKKSVDDVYSLIKKRGFTKKEAMEILEVAEKDWEDVSNLVDEKLSKKHMPVL